MLQYDYACMIEGTADTEPVDGLDLPATRRRIRKTANSAFLRTDLAAQLRALNVDTLVLAGAFIDGCVGLTAADAAQRGLDVVLVEDAIAHGNARRRSAIFEWLVDMYEMTTVTTEAACAARDRP